MKHIILLDLGPGEGQTDWEHDDHLLSLGAAGTASGDHRARRGGEKGD